MTSGIGPKYSRDELLDVLRRHLHAYKDDEQFVQRMMDIAAFLLEYRAYKARHLPGPETDLPYGELRQPYLRGPEQSEQELKMLLRNHKNRPQECRLCGAPTGGRAMCPNCGNMSL